MTNKSTELAKKEILRIVQTKIPNLNQSNAQTIANNIVNWIDWENESLMHKSLDQIVEIYLAHVLPYQS